METNKNNLDSRCINLLNLKDWDEILDKKINVIKEVG